MGRDFSYLDKEEEFIHDAIVASRQVQEFLWGDFNCSSANFEEFKRMYRKRLAKLESIDPNNPHALIEAKKRILQIAAISINFLHKIETNSLAEDPEQVTNLPEYAEPIKMVASNIQEAQFLDEKQKLKTKATLKEVNPNDFPSRPYSMWEDGDQ